MQAGVSEKVKLGQNLNPVDDATGVESIDYSASVDDLIGKVKKLKTLYDKGQIDADVLRYVPGMNKIMYQGQLRYEYGTIGVCYRINSRKIFKFFYYRALPSTNIQKKNK